MTKEGLVSHKNYLRPLQDRPVRGRQELGRGGEDRRRLRGLLLQGGRAGDILRLHKQLLGRHGVREAGRFPLKTNIII